MINKKLITGIVIANCILGLVAIIGYAMGAIETTTFFLVLAVILLNLLMRYYYKGTNGQEEN